MAIDVLNRLGGGQATRPPTAESAAARSNPRNAAAPSTATDLSDPARQGAGPLGTPAEGILPKNEVSLTKAVEEANSLAEVAYDQSERSVRFSRDEASGRLVMTIKEKESGEETVRQLPPEAFLKMLERLKEARGERDAKRAPALVNVSA
ncbi:MAG: flagellar protein FlaG [Bradymonadia bacterium]